MYFNRIFWRNVLLAVFVAVFSLGLLAPQGAFWHRSLILQQALVHGLLIGQFYYWLHQRPAKFWQIFLLSLTAIYYLWLYQALWAYVFFWILLLLLFFLALTYEQFIKWRKVPYLKTFLIPILWFVFLNLIPSILGSIGSISPLFLVLYFALSLQADREDLDQDNGQIKTIAGLLGARTSGYVVIFLISLSAYLLLIPLTETLILLVIMNREQFFPKRSFDSLLFLLGLYFLFR